MPLVVLLLNWSVEGKPIPTELRNEEAKLRAEVDLEDEQTAGIFYFIINFVCHFTSLIVIFFVNIPILNH